MCGWVVGGVVLQLYFVCVVFGGVGLVRVGSTQSMMLCCCVVVGYVVWMCLDVFMWVLTLGCCFVWGVGADATTESHWCVAC